MQKKIAYDIAKRALRACYTKDGIVAGKTHFDYVWARDSFYASFGALELGDYKIVKKNLETFFKYTKNGHVPLRIGASNFGQWLALIGIKPKFGVAYNQDKGLNPAIDPNLLLIITLDKYLEKTNDAKFAKKHLETIHDILDWLEAKEIDGLICGGKYATWFDGLKKEGFTLYTNALYYQALISLSNILQRLKQKNEFKEKANIIKDNINEQFWDKKLGYYIDFFNKKQKSKVFTIENLFAIMFNIADKKQTESILKNADKFNISKDIPSYTNYPGYDKSNRFLPFYLIGMQDYTDHGVCWTRLGPLHTIALLIAGKKDKAKEIHNKLGNYIERDNDVYETYDPKTDKPLNRLFYKSETSFSHAAGWYIMADKMLNEK